MVGMVCGNHQPSLVFARLDLDGRARPGGVPAPVRFLDHRGDVSFFAPGPAIIIGMADVDFARSFSPDDDISLRVLGAIAK